jgi:hypothetical protein
MTWAKGLGKGRRNASDGLAWNAALRGALSRLLADLGGTEVVLSPSTLVEGDGSGIVARVGNVRSHLSDPDGRRAQMAAAVICAVGRGESLALDDVHPSLRVEGDLEAWGRLYNICHDAMEALAELADAAREAVDVGWRGQWEPLRRRCIGVNGPDADSAETAAHLAEGMRRAAERRLRLMA